ncbi:MAG: alpha/beta fold hydrolase [Bryobacteraceae bacterium]
MRIGNKRWLIYAAAAVSAGTAVKFAIAVRTWHKLLRLGHIRELLSCWYDVGGRRIYARSAGEPGSPPVVLIPGWSVSSSYFVPFAERLASRFRVYSPDLPGNGYSAAPTEPLDIAGLTKVLLDWMDAAKIGRAILVGHSMGAQIALEAALRAPQRVDRIVLIGLTPEPGARNTIKHGSTSFPNGRATTSTTSIPSSGLQRSKS